MSDVFYATFNRSISYHFIILHRFCQACNSCGQQLNRGGVDLPTDITFPVRSQTFRNSTVVTVKDLCLHFPVTPSWEPSCNGPDPSPSAQRRYTWPIEVSWCILADTLFLLRVPNTFLTIFVKWLKRKQSSRYLDFLWLVIPSIQSGPPGRRDDTSNCADQLPDGIKGALAVECHLSNI